jgi:polysaccharide export outer membrane protein
LVAEDGTIFYPYVGTVKVAGKTVADVRQILTRKISRTIADPQLDVRVAAFRSQRAYVVGEVATPGPQPLTDIPLTVVEAVNQAGGVTPEADMVNVTLSRNGVVFDINLLSLYEQGDVSQDVLLQHGDILHIPNRIDQKVFVLGEVTAPSSYLMNKGRKTLSEALSDAGGVIQVSANASRVFVIRGSARKTSIYYLNSESPDALVLGDKFQLEPRDIVYVDTSGLTRWNRVVSQLLPTTQLLRNLSDIESQTFNNNNNN